MVSGDGNNDGDDGYDGGDDDDDGCGDIDDDDDGNDGGIYIHICKEHSGKNRRW